MSKTWFLLLWFSLLPVNIKAQQYSFRNIGTDHGLPSSECYYTYQDHKGYIWFCTNAGLAKYNGRTFKIFTTVSGLTSNVVFRVWEDESGRLFYITSNSRLGYILNDIPHTLPVTDTLARLLLNGKLFINSIEDFNKDSLLIATQQGFYYIDKKTLSHLRALPTLESVAMMVKVKNGKVFGTTYPVAKKRGRISMGFLHIESENWEQLIWVEVAGGFNFFKTLQLADGRTLVSVAYMLFIIYPDGHYEKKILPAPINALYQDDKGGVWVSLLRYGVYYYQQPDLARAAQHLFQGRTVTSVMNDREKGIWISTLSEAVYYCPSLDIVHYADKEDLDIKLYALNYIPPYIVTNGLNNTVYLFSHKKKYKKVSLPAFCEGAYDYLKKNGKIYVAGYMASCMLDTGFRFLNFLPEKGSLYRFAAGNDGSVWGIRWNQLFHMPDAATVHSIQLPERGKDISIDKEGRVYVATHDGLYLYINDGFSKLVQVKGNINRLKADKKGNMWVCTDGGLLQISSRLIIKSYTLASGLPSGICYDVTFDDEDNIWIATNKGLCCIDKQQKANVYTIHDGLLSNELFKVEVKDTELYMCTQKGLCIADITKLKPDSMAPPVYISSVFNRNKAVDQKKIFTNDENDFVFTAEGLSFRSPDNISYYYRLLPFDTVWNTSTTGKISYNNISDGSYTFEVLAQTGGGAVSKIPARYHFIIKAPYWKSWWFISLVIIAISGLCYGIIAWRTLIIKKRESRKTAINKLVAEYQMTALQAQMNPHFIFNAINSIQHYILNHEAQEAYDYLAKFGKLIRQVLANSQQHTISLEKEIKLLRLYLDLEQRRSGNKFDYDISCAAGLPVEEIEIPVMLIQPFVENAIWHGLLNLGESKKGKLHIIMSLEKDILHISVEDNGIGRKAAAIIKSKSHYQSIGIMLSQKRMETMRLTGHAATRIEIHDLEDEHAIASGTRVDIFIPILF